MYTWAEHELTAASQAQEDRPTRCPFESELKPPPTRPPTLGELLSTPEQNPENRRDDAQGTPSMQCFALAEPST